MTPLPYNEDGAKELSPKRTEAMYPVELYLFSLLLIVYTLSGIKVKTTCYMALQLYT